ncbi:PmoA family protein [Cryobacterium sp. Y62]|uniref:DUF6807 domain-containing protein n=1 Tax=Cryobacterium sp. Y62 TaxID=2048284 RepID=UPI000CE309FE|nr:PmoA family protein [Cryobacterium sp. Y62]
MSNTQATDAQTRDAAAPAPLWSLELGGHCLSLLGRPVAEYRTAAGMAPQDSPRPFLHPVGTLGGRLMSETAPADHRHHFGVSLAVPDVDGTSYWGGSTFVRDHGSTLLANHGKQEGLSRAAVGGVLTEELLWRNERGGRQLTESRTIDARLLPCGDAWALTWTSVLRATERTVSLGSPATNGRLGAGYGGIFWRLPTREQNHILSIDGAGEDRAHQSQSPWIAINQNDAGQRIGLLLSQPATTIRPWFLRATEYVGGGPMLAPNERLVIEYGGALTTSLRGIVLDRWVEDESDAAALLALAKSGAHE